MTSSSKFANIHALWYDAFGCARRRRVDTASTDFTMIDFDQLGVYTPKCAAKYITQLVQASPDSLTIMNVVPAHYPFIIELCALVPTLYQLTIAGIDARVEINTDTSHVSYVPFVLKTAQLIRELNSKLVHGRKLRITTHTAGTKVTRICGDTPHDNQVRENCLHVLANLSTLVAEGRVDVPVQIQQMLTDAYAGMVVTVANARRGIYE